jgi:hypothetical protein
MSKEILTTAVEGHAYGATPNGGGRWSDAVEGWLFLVVVQR